MRQQNPACPLQAGPGQRGTPACGGVITTVISGSSAALLLPVTEEPHWGGFVRLLPAFAGLQETLSQRHAATYHIYGFLKSEAAGSI